MTRRITITISDHMGWQLAQAAQRLGCTTEDALTRIIDQVDAASTREPDGHIAIIALSPDVTACLATLNEGPRLPASDVIEEVLRIVVNSPECSRVLVSTGKFGKPYTHGI